MLAANNGATDDVGTTLANTDHIQSCQLASRSARAAKRDRAAPPRRERASREAAKGTRGGSRNRADRCSQHLSARQCKEMLGSAGRAMEAGRVFSRHWTIHYERAGISDRDGAAFVGKVLKRAGEHVRRSGGQLAAIWARENGDGKGAHVHILLALPAGYTLRNRTRRWIVAAGGTYRKGVSAVRAIGGTLASARTNDERHRENVGNVLAYLMKGAAPDAGTALALERNGQAGLVVGKRCGWTQNIGRASHADRGSHDSLSPSGSAGRI